MHYETRYSGSALQEVLDEMELLMESYTEVLDGARIKGGGQENRDMEWGRI